MPILSKVSSQSSANSSVPAGFTETVLTSTSTTELATLPRLSAESRLSSDPHLSCTPNWTLKALLNMKTKL